MTLLVVQCRVSSTRLPGKALLPLGERTVLDWTLRSMKKVAADEYYVATDEESFEQLSPVAKRNGFKIFAGPLDDVLKRFCLLIEKTEADTVIRATADNPFLFFDAASSLLEAYEKRLLSEPCDYITYEGLPHGSGVEIFNAKSLLKAFELTSESYDHEHVGPALYRHPENFKSVFITAPKKWNFPDIRTTIDTEFDYKRALNVVQKMKKDGPYTSKEITDAFSEDDIRFPVLCVPCVKKGKGTGHLRRCLCVASALKSDIYISDDADLDEIDELLSEAFENGLEKHQIVRKLPQKGEYALILTDSFVIERSLALALADCAPLAAVDEGSLNTDLCDYLLDIIPSYDLQRPGNISEPSFVTMPKNKRETRISSRGEIHSILVTVGGEDPQDLVFPAAVSFSKLGYKITAIVQNPEKAKERLGEDFSGQIEFISPVHNLRDELYKFDVVVTHYGFTAFEAIAAGCAVILLGTTPLHVNLAKKYGFKCIESQEITEAGAEEALRDISALYPESPLASKNAGNGDLPGFVRNLSKGKRYSCPVCREHHRTFEDLIVSRTPERTFRRCNNCGLLYISYSAGADETRYDGQYFFESYKKQYGKTYLEDFMTIKSQCVRRTSLIDYIFRNSHRVITPAVLDVGCAFGPFMDAANDAGWQVFGTDISKEAVRYVQETLHFPASCASYPDFDSVDEFGIKEFDAVTMWYVIEHFENLDRVLKAVSKNLKPGGVFAFSTPSAGGVSGKFNTQSFFQNSPKDHYSLWEPSRAASILKKYGFKVVKIVSTGHHPERFPDIAKENVRPNSLKFALHAAASRFFGLGDTFEVYCVKEREIDDE